jgi:hypothetical protein
VHQIAAQRPGTDRAPVWRPRHQVRRDCDLPGAGDEVPAVRELAQQRFGLDLDRIDLRQEHLQRLGIERVLEQEVPVVVIAPRQVGADAAKRAARRAPVE